MTLAKRLLLGSAAAVVATTGAQAADLGLPVAPAVEYVQICTIGSFTGFLLPGSDVCFDISGYARGQLTWTEEIDPFAWGTGTALAIPDMFAEDDATTLDADGVAFNPLDGIAAWAPAASTNAAGELAFEATTTTAATIAAIGYNAAVSGVNVGWNWFSFLSKAWCSAPSPGEKQPPKRSCPGTEQGR
jgi:opacity protein-like surface antigen